MVGQRYPVLNWPYIEGLRIDEAMHPLTTVVTGLYGKPLPNQNGAPLRIFIPWLGFSLSELLNKVQIKPTAKFVEFETVYNPEEMVGQRYPVLNWPYIEGLRIDEAMHPLTTVVTGLYGKPLPNQNGAPLRIFIPWKYGFKSAKAIVKIRVTEKMPNTAWKNASPREYGFYSNVNPEVDHPRWSQATERVIGESLLAPRIKTSMFNGYGDEVAHLYSGMDLKKNY